MGKIWQGSESADNIDLRPSDRHKFDVVWAKSGDDLVHGRDFSSLSGANDTISGANGNDVIYGHHGDDFLSGEGDSDTIYGGPGNDAIRGGYHDWIPGGTPDGADKLYGEEGDDMILAEGGDDQIWGGPGNDRLFGEHGNDQIWGEDGDDYIDVGPGLDSAWGGNGNDTITSNWMAGRKYLSGEDGNDTIFGGENSDIIEGGPGDDVLWGLRAYPSSGGDTIDRIYGGPGNDLIYGDSFYFPNDGLWSSVLQYTQDIIWGGSGNDTIQGMAGNDTIYGGEGNDIIYGGYDPSGSFIPPAEFHGDNFIDVGTGHNFAYGGPGNDVIKVSGEISEQGFNILIGGDGDDLIQGGDNSVPIEDLVVLPGLEEQVKELKEFIKTLENAEGVVPTIGDFIDGGKGFNTIEAGDGTDIILAGLPTSANTKDKVQLIYGNSKTYGKREADIFIVSTVAISRKDAINQAMVADITKLSLKGLKVGLKVLSVAGAVVPGGKIPELALEMGILGVEIFSTISKYSAGKPQEPSILDKMTVIKDFDPGLDVLYLDNGGGKIRYSVTYQHLTIGDKDYRGLVFRDGQGKSEEPRVILEGLTNRHIEQMVSKVVEEEVSGIKEARMISYTFLPNIKSDKPESLQQFPEPYIQGSPFVLTEDNDHVTVIDSESREIQALGGDDEIIVDFGQRVFAGAGDDEIYAGISLGGNTLSGGIGKDQFWFYDDQAAEVIDSFKETIKIVNVGIADANEQERFIRQIYGDMFGEGSINVIVDFDIDEDSIGFADFLVPVGVNDVQLRQEGNDAIISLFARDVALLQGVNVESLSPESFTFDNSLFENVMGNNDNSIVDEQDDLVDVSPGNDDFGNFDPNFAFPSPMPRISAEELLNGRKITSLQSEGQSLSLSGDVMGTDGDDRIIVNSNQEVFAGAGNDVIYASISTGGNTLSGGSGKDQFWFYDDPNGTLGINIVENVIDEGGFSFDAIEEYGQRFSTSAINVITDFNPEEDVIGVVDFPFPLGLNSFTSRQEGNDFIISLFEKDILLLQNIQEENLTTENFVFDKSLFESIEKNFSSPPNFSSVVPIANDIQAGILDNSFHVKLSDETQMVVKYQNQPFVNGTFGNWQILEAETINGINQILWRNPDIGEVGIWNTDANWNWISSETWSANSLKTLNAEVTFQIDINNDQLIGDSLTNIETKGSISLLGGIFGYHVQTGDGLTTPLRYLGEAFENDFGNWQALAAEIVEGINQVLWQNQSSGEIGVWYADSNWNWVFSNVFAPSSSQALAQFNAFGVAINETGLA
jgi:Ca2+-binding RTX toxin-like protein